MKQFPVDQQVVSPEKGISIVTKLKQINEQKLNIG